MRFHFSIYIGRLLLSSRGVFLLRQHRAVRNTKTYWLQWDRIL